MYSMAGNIFVKALTISALTIQTLGFLVTPSSNALLKSYTGSRLFSPRGVSLRSTMSRTAVSMNTMTDLTEEIQVLRNELIRKDAIIEGLLATLAKTAITTKSKPMVSAAPLTELCQISKEVSINPHLSSCIQVSDFFGQACDAVTPMLQAFYAKITDERHGGASKLKSDATYFTIADGSLKHYRISFN
jgi:hypothetical protein